MHLYGLVENIEDHGDVKKVITDDEEFETRTVIVATGSKHRLLGVPGEEERREEIRSSGRGRRVS